jgi:hypothetical protein
VRRFLPTKGSSRNLAIGAIVIALLLTLEGVALVGLQRAAPFSIVVGDPNELGTGLSVPVTFASHLEFPIALHAALLPVTYSKTPRAAFVFEDPGFAVRFGSFSDLDGLYGRVATELSLSSSPTSLTAVDAAQLPSALAANPEGILIVAEVGALPSTVFSNSTDLLGSWMHGGGTLVWAGGPLGFYSQNPAGISGPNGTIGPGWNGQELLLGYPLVDPPKNGSLGYTPLENGNLTGTLPTALCEGLGLQYDGTLYGANVTQVQEHGGVSLGYETPPLPTSAASPATSLAYVPVGSGSLFYFGGADYGPGVSVPSGGLLLSYDVAELLQFPYIPSSGEVSIVNLNLTAFETETITLGVSDRETGIALLVETQVIGSTLYELTDQLSLPADHSGGVRPFG